MIANNNLLKLFGQSVRNKRLYQKLTQEELADIAGFDRTYISLIERGKRNISLLNIYRLSKALKTSTSDLVKNFR